MCGKTLIVNRALFAYASIEGQSSKSARQEYAAAVRRAHRRRIGLRAGSRGLRWLPMMPPTADIGREHTQQERKLVQRRIVS